VDFHWGTERPATVVGAGEDNIPNIALVYLSPAQVEFTVRPDGHGRTATGACISIYDEAGQERATPIVGDGDAHLRPAFGFRHGRRFFRFAFAEAHRRLALSTIARVQPRGVQGTVWSNEQVMERV
jgi:hypothetical protein